MNSFQIYQQGNFPTRRISQNDMRINYVYNRANQNIDHLRDNFNNNPREAPIRIIKNVYRNESNGISSVLNNDPYHFNKRFNDSNSSNNYNSTNYSSFQNNNNNNENKFQNNNDIYRRSQYSNFNRNNNNYNYTDNNNYQKVPIYPQNLNRNSMNNINPYNLNLARNDNLNSNEMINFNGLNLNIGSKFNNINNNINNYNNLSHNNSYENNLRRSNYSNKSENINIGNNHYNINLSSITSQDIYQSFEKQKKENERKKKEEYSNYLKQQIQEKNKRKELEKQKKLKEDMEFEQKYKNDYNRWEQSDLTVKTNNNKIENFDNKQIIKSNNKDNEINYNKDENNLDKNILETLKKNQYPLINDINIKSIENMNNRNKKNDYKIEDTNELSRETISTRKSMVKSGLNIIEGNKNKENFYEKEINNENDLNNSNKKINSNRETELYLDKIIAKTDLLSETLNKGQADNDQRMKDILKVLENNKNDNFNRINNIESKNNYTPVKNRMYKDKAKVQEIQDVNVNDINFRSKYENYENINNLNSRNKTNNKSKYISDIKNNEEPQLIESMKGISEFVTSTSKNKFSNIAGKNLFNPNYNSKNTAHFINEREKDKKYILKDVLLQNKNNVDKKSDLIDVKDSLNSDMKLTFGEGSNVKFIMENNNYENYKNKVNESLSTLNDTKNQDKNVSQYSFGENVRKEINKKNIERNRGEKKMKKEKIEEEDMDEEEDEEKYDIKVNSENDINYDNMLKSTKTSDLKFLDFDQFCDIENENEDNPKNKKKKKKNKSNKNKKSNMNEINEDDEICNITISDKEKENNENNTEKGNDNDNDNVNKMTESKKVQMQLNFFSDSVTKGISHKRNDKSIFKNNNENNVDNMDLLSEESLDKIKNKKSNDDKVDEINKNILEESEDLKDSYCDNILKNIDKYRGDLQKD